jgi:hypothetical protein
MAAATSPRAGPRSERPMPAICVRRAGADSELPSSGRSAWSSRRGDGNAVTKRSRDLGSRRPECDRDQARADVRTIATNAVGRNGKGRHRCFVGPSHVRSTV